MKMQLTIASLLATLVLVTAFAPMPSQPDTSDETNVTIIYKTNLNWPVRGMITLDPCAVRNCSSI